MISLTEKLNHSIEYHGKFYPVNLAFDNVLRFYEMLDDELLDNEYKFLAAFKMFFGDNAPQDTKFIVTGTDALIRYIGQQSYGASGNNKDIGGNELESIKYYSYTKDSEAIFASFMQCYHINLVRELYKPVQQRLHWDEFKALFNGLSEDTYIMRIIDIRRRTTDGLEGESLAALQEAKDYFALETQFNAQTQEKRADDLFSGMYNIAKHQREGK